MFRWFNPALFTGVAFYVRYYNSNHATSQLLFPGTEQLTEGDLFAAGQLTWKALLVFAVLLAVWAVYREIRIRSHHDEDSDDQ